MESFSFSMYLEDILRHSYILMCRYKSNTGVKHKNIQKSDIYIERCNMKLRIKSDL
ncbi:hypothetical protein ERO13_A12G029550v2 [Gossypium hirsutum]|uniref:Uncharacterized protein n=1 Tax=Gossypium mustelinum TaxID=34275 RepID=A0A5D2WPN6_GOSMU|nr:hypothetical protein ERO13_A12G029550v2 [Gossypium hirsutum]TYJ03469.1 hypothetical protein E1A91_A12G029500v1 [Gossypium mustelinum]